MTESNFKGLCERTREMTTPVLALLGLLLGLALTVGTSQAETAPSKPNIVLLLIDDWAWNGSPVPMDDSMANSKMPVLQMPNLQRLALEGMKFRNAYAGAPQCSPSRVCIQTGQTSARSGYTVYLGKTRDDYYDTRRQYQKLPVVPNVSDSSIDPGTTTIAEALKPLGYSSAHMGKWHIGGDPGQQGYEVHDGNTNNNPGNTLGKAQRQPEDITDPKLMFSVTKRAIGFMRQQVKAGNPFYLQVSHYAMHAGRECLNETRQKYAMHPLVQDYYQQVGRTAETINRKQDPAIWLGMGEDLDTCIGQVLDEIKALGIEEETYVVVTSDNGYRHRFFPGLAQPLHAAKWWIWQGGIRVPMIVKGPGIQAGSVFEDNVVNYDFLPTFLEWAGGDPAHLSNIDGVSLASYLRGNRPEAAFRNRFLYFHYPHYRTTMPHSAIVSGTRKVIHFYERPQTLMLFDLAADEGEVENIAENNRQQHRALFDQMMRYFEMVGARIPTVNPDYDPQHYKETKEYETRMRWGPFEGRRQLDNDEQPASRIKSTEPTERVEPPQPPSKTAQPPASLLGPKETVKALDKKLPNIVFIFADDLGYGDLGCYGHPYARTPTLDKLASEGTRFTQFYVTGVTCCPSRTGIMTGLFPARFQKYPAAYGFGDRATVTELLKKRGYRTGHFGKWHIGPETENVYGIDEYRSGGSRGDPRGRDAGLFDEAIRFLKDNADKPMYINVWGHATHHPVNTHPGLVEKFQDVVVNRADFSQTMQLKFDQCRSIGGDLNLCMRQYLGDVYSIDQNVKRLLEAIDQLGLRENTIVVFSSDQGPAPVLLGAKKESKKFSTNMLGYAGEFRGGKHQQYEGGVRAPFIVRWPGHVKANHLDDESVISGADWLPTLCRIAGIQEIPRDLDGEDVSDIWLGAKRQRTKPLLWKTSSPRSSPSIRKGKWKLHLNPRGSQGVELYDLSMDPAESRNLASEVPDVVVKLTRQVNSWVAELPRRYEKSDTKKSRKRTIDCLNSSREAY